MWISQTQHLWGYWILHNSKSISRQHIAMQHATFCILPPNDIHNHLKKNRNQAPIRTYKKNNNIAIAAIAHGNHSIMQLLSLPFLSHSQVLGVPVDTNTYFYKYLLEIPCVDISYIITYLETLNII